MRQAESLHPHCNYSVGVGGACRLGCLTRYGTVLFAAGTKSSTPSQLLPPTADHSAAGSNECPPPVEGLLSASRRPPYTEQLCLPSTLLAAETTAWCARPSLQQHPPRPPGARRYYCSANSLPRRKPLTPTSHSQRLSRGWTLTTRLQQRPSWILPPPVTRGPFLCTHESRQRAVNELHSV